MQVTNNTAYLTVKAFKQSIQTLEDAMEQISIDSELDCISLARGIVDIAKGSFSTGFGLVTGITFTDLTKEMTAIITTYTPEYTFAPTDALDTGVTFSSTDAAVATVDEDGIVTAVADGTCQIIITTDDGGFKDTINLTVALA